MRCNKPALAFRLACLLAPAVPVLLSCGVSAVLAQAPGEPPNVSPPAAPLKGNVSNISHRRLDNGPLLLSPLKEGSIVDTPYGEVSVTAGSVALIICSDKELCVYNLHDSRKDAVVINCGKENVALGKTRISLSPERVAVFAKSSMKTFAEANPAPFVAYRQISIKDLSGEYKLFQADFDFGSMARGLPQLRKLMDSEIGEQRKTMGDVLKTAAIMTQMSQSSEPYGYYVTDRVRAISAGAH